MDHFATLNEKQAEAVRATEGPLLIVAGAGTGKTKTLTHRIYHLIHQGVHPSAILAITFTNKAAREMRERVMKMLEADHVEARSQEAGRSARETPMLKTFHSLGVYILRRFSREVGLKKEFAILDSNDTMKLIKEATTHYDRCYKPCCFTQTTHSISKRMIQETLLQSLTTWVTT
jgi:DNA helicase-2/ATP-dependent DNA helicase PcrA